MNEALVRWCPAYIGLGSNLASPRQQIESAAGALAQLPKSQLIRMSSLYQSAPMGPADQPDYINAVAAIMTQLSPQDLLIELQRIEDEHGRERKEHWGARTLDLDLLVFGRQQIEESDLTVPHAGIRERNFVLLPLQELAPYLDVPGTGAISTLVAAIADSENRIEKIE
jgi:2-amino-4-hydroxy-6-hydroxymethyldihydropteridine diphosphokinase